MEIKKAKKLSGSLAIPGDKSISHRAVMFGSLAEGTTKITNFLEGADCLSTISCFRKMGINIENTEGEILVHGKGLHGLSAPSETLDVGNSGTTTRLISGILAGQDFVSELTGDASIQKRPMKRIMTPLSQMGADIISLNGNGCAPLKISGKKLHAIHYNSPVAGKILCTPCRNVFGRHYLYNRAGSLQKSHGDHAELLWRQCNRRGNNSIHQTGPISLRT